MKHLFKVLCVMIVLASNELNAQSESCGSHEHHKYMLMHDPEYAKQRKSIEDFTEAYTQSPSKARAVKTIPVVFHILYNNQAQNVSDAQIYSQLAVLNADFRKQNADTTAIPLPFKSLAADCEIQFCLAQRDPNGNPTTGINRFATNVASFSGNDAIKYSAQGGADIWDRNKYLNVWVGNWRLTWICTVSGGTF